MQKRSIHADFAAIRDDLVTRACSNLEMGGRGIGNMLETALINPLARKLFDEDVPDGVSLRVEAIEKIEGSSGALACSLRWKREG